MTVDFTKLPFNGVTNPAADTLTDAITAPPVDGGFVVVTLKTDDVPAAVPHVRDFIRSLRADGSRTGLVDVTLYRQLDRSELGGAVPFDQSFCERLLADIAARRDTQVGRFPGLASADAFALSNPVADLVLFVTFETTAAATEAVHAWHDDASAFRSLARHLQGFTIGAFRNMQQYAHVSLDPDAIQFFNLFPGPGDGNALWDAWQEVLPRYFDVAGIRSSFPLQALDPDQSILLVNYAHADSMKYFLLGMVFDPNFLEDITRCYVERGFGYPHPFFCKIIPG